jgi:alpha-galactosidase
MDVDEHRLSVMTSLASELAAAEGSHMRVRGTLEQKEALDRVDFALVTISVGGMAAWESDIEVPARHGVFMHIADSIGPGGIFRALRNTPVVASVAEDLATLAPRAIVLNYTNPASANAMAVASVSGIRSLSLCSCSPLPFDKQWIADLAGVPAHEILLPLQVGGINHCTGIMDLRLKDGRDAIPLIRERTQDEIVAWAIDTFGVVPYCWAHWCEFFPSLQRLEEPYRGRAQGLAMRYGRHIYDMAKQREPVATWEELARGWQDSPGQHRLTELPLGQKMRALSPPRSCSRPSKTDRNSSSPTSVTSRCSYRTCPPTAPWKYRPLFPATACAASPSDRCRPGLAGILARHAQVERLTMQAALTGDRSLLDQAMSADPLLEATLEPGQIGQLTADMLEANRPYLAAGSTARLYNDRSLS